METANELQAEYVIEAIAVLLGENRGYGKKAVQMFLNGDYAMIKKIGIETDKNIERLIMNAKKRLAEICKK